MLIRKLGYDDLEEASKVLWKSFYEAEKKNTSMDGMAFFRDLISPVSLSMNSFDGSIVLYGGFLEEKMVVVGALKEKNTVLMLYVLPEYWHRGLGKKMLFYLEDQCDSEELYLNSSDGAVDFYLRYSYQCISPRKVENDLIFTPMKKRRGNK